ncbi:hypothetical protein ACFTAO_15095 [Paenibacillus rhizoplanae]
MEQEWTSTGLELLVEIGGFMPYHFALKVLEGKRGLKLTREKYAVVNNKKIHWVILPQIFMLMRKESFIQMNGVRNS